MPGKENRREAAAAVRKSVLTDRLDTAEDRYASEGATTVTGSASASDSGSELEMDGRSALTIKIENTKGGATVEKEAKAGVGAGAAGGAGRRRDAGGGAKARAMAETKAKVMARGLAKGGAGTPPERHPFTCEDGVSIYPIPGGVLSDAGLDVWGFINSGIAGYKEYKDFETSLSTGCCGGSGGVLLNKGIYKIRPSARMDARCLGMPYESVDDIKRVLGCIYVGEDKDMPSRALAHMMKTHLDSSKLVLVDFSTYTDHEGVKEILKTGRGMRTGAGM